MKQSAPMKRTGFQRKPGVSWAGLSRSAALARKSPLKSRRKRVTKAEGGDYLAACYGEECYLRVRGVCCFDRETVVPCHDNRLSAGKGMSLKSSHERTLPGCWTCHSWLDQGPAPREEKFAAFDRGFEQWAPVRAAKLGMRGGI